MRMLVQTQTKMPVTTTILAAVEDRNDYEYNCDVRCGGEDNAMLR